MSAAARQSGKAQLANTTHARVACLAAALKHTRLGPLMAPITVTQMIALFKQTYPTARASENGEQVPVGVVH
jgi:hypothetical protein